MEMLADLWDWAWQRHHNVWSWYIRPLFLIPYCWAAWRRSSTGIVLTLLALLSSMAWFPAPAEPDPQVTVFLAAEREFLTAPMTLHKLAMLALIPASLAALALACWRRSIGWALLVITLIAAGKILWSFMQDASATRLLPPALLGLGLCWGAGLIWRRWRRQ